MFELLGLLPTLYFIGGYKLLSVDLNNKVVLGMFESSQQTREHFALKQVEGNVGLSSSAKTLLQEIKRSEEYYIL